MAIPVNPLNDSAVTALANSRVGYMNLPLHAVDISGLTKPLFEAVKAKYDAQQQMAQIAAQGQNALDTTNAVGQNELQRQALVNQGQLQYGQQQNLFQGGQNELERALKQQELNNTAYYQQGQLGLTAEQNRLRNLEIENVAKYQQGQLGIAQQNVDLDKQKTQAEAMVNQLKAKMLLDDKDLAYRSAVGAVYTRGMQLLDPKDPEYKQKLSDLQQQTLEEAHSSGYISDAEYKAGKNMTPQQFAQHAQMEIYINAMASGAKNNPQLMNSLMGINAAPGTTFSIDPSTGALTYSSIPQKDTTSKTQEAIQANQQMQQQSQGLTQLIRENPDIFTTKGNLQTTVGSKMERNPEIADYVKPYLPNFLQPENTSPIQNASNEYDLRKQSIQADWAKTKSPFLLRNKEFMDNLLESRTSGDFSSALVKSLTLDRINRQTAQLDSQYLKNGIPLDQKAYTDKLNAAVDDGIVYSQTISKMINNKYADATGRQVNLIETIKANPNIPIEKIVSGLKVIK